MHRAYGSLREPVLESTDYLVVTKRVKDAFLCRIYQGVLKSRPTNHSTFRHLADRISPPCQGGELFMLDIAKSRRLGVLYNPVFQSGDKSRRMLISAIVRHIKKCLFKFIKNILFIKINVKIFEKFQILFSKSMYTMMLFLILDVLINRIYICCAVRKNSITFLPSESLLGQVMVIDVF